MVKGLGILSMYSRLVRAGGNEFVIRKRLRYGCFENFNRIVVQ
jgi:hypothetical protein